MERWNKGNELLYTDEFPQVYKSATEIKTTTYSRWK